MKMNNMINNQIQLISNDKLLPINNVVEKSQERELSIKIEPKLAALSSAHSLSTHIYIHCGQCTIKPQVHL